MVLYFLQQRQPPVVPVLQEVAAADERLYLNVIPTNQRVSGEANVSDGCVVDL